MLSLAALTTLACQLAEPGTIDVDGMLDDWKGVAEARAGGKDKDASFGVRCLVAGDKLALLVDVRDDQLVRLAQKKKQADDLIRIDLAGLALQLAPGTERIAPARLVAGKQAPRWIAIEDGQQPRGFAIELEVPLGKLPRWSAGAASLEASVAFLDGDDWKTRDAPLALGVELALGEKPKLYQRFLRDARLKKSEVVLDAQADVDRARAGKERVVAGRDVLGLITDRYGWVTLGGAVQKIELVDLRGDGSRVVMTHVRQEGGGGSRDLLSFWGASGGELEPIFAVEVRKEADGNRLESAWKLARKKKGKGLELVVEARPAVGWDEDTFEEVPAEDAEPIHVPWDPARSGAAYWLDGDTLRSRPLKKRR